MDQNVLKTAVDDLEERRKALGEQLLKTEEAIKALQEICEHEFKLSGRDSHHTYEKCIYCGIEQKA